MEGKNIFLKGIEQDLALDKIPADFYFDALNMDIVTETGGSTGNIRNVKGTAYAQVFPDVPAIYAITERSGFDSTTTSDIIVEVNGQDVTFLGLTESFTAIANAVNNDPTFQAMGVRAYTNEESLYNDTPTLYITLISGSITSCNVIASAALFDITLYAANQGQLNLIGWVLMRDEFILFTSNSSNPDPVNQLGQIWRFTYDKVNFTTNLTLLYNNYINLSSAHPIANPTMIEARYETPSLQNVYWTDNYNPPRTVNVADPNLYSLDPRILNLSTIVSPYILIPTQINQSGGGLKTGLHYASYRLSRETGGETNFFLPSYGITIVESNEETDPIVRWTFDSAQNKFILADYGYSGGGTGVLFTGLPTTKSITYKLDAIDTNYTRIEFAHIYKKNASATPVIHIVGNEPITDSSMEFTITGVEDDKVALTPEEFNSTNEIFSRVGTMCAKDNYLFFGNVETSVIDLDWDARAYRFNASQVCNIQDDLGNTDVVDALFQIGGLPVPEDHACINPNDDPNSNTNFLYQTDGTTLGGEGPNVKFTFVTESMVLDNHSNLTETGGNVVNPARDVAKGILSYDLYSSAPVTQTYVSPNTFRSYHSPYLSGFLRGYTRDEVYRFAIVFYDHSHNPLFAKWIADIRMPHMWMPSGALGYERTLQYPLTNTAISYAATKFLIGESLGVEFTVSNLGGLGNQVSGYSIVRSIRTHADKTIKAQGLFQPAFLIGGDTRLVSHSYAFSATNAVSPEVATLTSPEFLFSPAPVFSTGDMIDIVAIYGADFAALTSDEGGGPYTPPNPGHDVGRFIKNYCHGAVPDPIVNTTTRTPFILDATVPMAPWFDGGSVPFTIDTVGNVTNHSGGGSPGGRAGGKVLVLKGDFAEFPAASTEAYITADTMPSSEKMYIANYRRNLRTGHLSTQYSGNTYSQRSTSEYISTNHYQPITMSSSSYVNRVYGGDTYIDIMDVFTQFYDTGSLGSSDSGMLTRYFPVETAINIGMRQVYSDNGYLKIPNKAMFKQDEFPFRFEDFFYNSIFSAVNDIKTFFPKPVPYLPQTVFDTRVYNSALPKINGELVDSWRVFKPEDYIEMDTKYGPVNALVTQRNRLFFFQDRAIGIYQTNEKALVQDATGGEIILGTGGIKQRFDYLSERIGCRHKFSISQSPSSIFFFDMGTRRPYLLKEGIKEVQGLNGFFQDNLTGDILYSDNPYLYKGITSIFDNKYDKYLITFHDQNGDVGTLPFNQFTLGLNDQNERFVSFYSHIPRTYFTDKDNLFSTDLFRGGTIESIYRHNAGDYGVFYNDPYPSYVTFLTNQHPEVEKIFDNLLFNSKTYLNEVDIPNVGFTSFRVWNDYQNTGDKLLDSNRARFIKRKWNVAIGGDLNNQRLTERIKSNYAFNKLEIDNLNNHEIILESVISKFRLNSTML